jgi:hypothetical protein
MQARSGQPVSNEVRSNPALVGTEVQQVGLNDTAETIRPVLPMAATGDLQPGFRVAVE